MKIEYTPGELSEAMTLNQLIEKLQALANTHGDAPVSLVLWQDRTPGGRIRKEVYVPIARVGHARNLIALRGSEKYGGNGI